MKTFTTKEISAVMDKLLDDYEKDGVPNTQRTIIQIAFSTLILEISLKGIKDEVTGV